ncbi:MAG TPA: hypothetical protein VMX15_02925 [Candidatus Heimdallarchaeota archaeon]|nr:hypothetical protein [Candidatus Heimdallarchaeota archaeon]
MQNGISISNVGTEAESVFAMGEVIIAILASEQEQETIRVALEAFANAVPATVTVSGCSVYGDTPKAT